MRILVLTDWYPERPGDPTGSFVRTQALTIARDHEVTVLHLRRPPVASARPRLERLRDGPLRVLRLRAGPRRPMTIANLVATLAALRSIHAHGGRPQLLHGHEMGAGLMTVLAARLLDLPSVVSEHSSSYATDEVTPAHAFITRIVFGRAEIVCPVSDSLRRALEAGAWGGTYRVVPNALDTDVFAPDTHPGRAGRGEQARILTIAALEPVKGVVELVEALALARDHGARFQATLVGTGPLQELVRARIAALGLEQRLELTPPVAHDGIPGLLRQASFLVIPSRFETFSMALSEALACGLPVVATRVGALADRIDASNGILCPAENPPALAAAIEQMLARYRDYDASAIAAQVRGTYSPEAVADRWDEVYGEAIEMHGRRRAV